ncbi:MAG: substrate-binding periplasmic protein [Aestuariibacter sp.]
MGIKKLKHWLTICCSIPMFFYILNVPAQVPSDNKKLTEHAPNINEKIDIVLFGDDSYVPYSYVNHDGLVGFYPSLINRVAEGLPEYRVRLAPIPWKRGLKRMENGTGLGLFPPYLFEKERPFIRPYSYPLFTEEVTVFCRSDVLQDSFNGQWPSDYYGKTISTNLGFKLFKKEMWEPFKSGDISHVEFQGTDENLFQLAVTGLADCYANDRNSITLGLKKLEQKLTEQGREHLLHPIQETTVLLQQRGYIGYSKKFRKNFPDSDRFIERFDEALEQFIASGEYRTFVTNYWQEQVYIDAGLQYTTHD